MNRTAVIYRRDGRVIIAAKKRTINGVYIEMQPVVVSPEHDAGAIAAALRTCLDAFQDQVPHPTDWTAELKDKPVLKAAKVRSYKQFHIGATSVQAVLRDGTLTLTPTRNLGNHEGFEELPSQVLTVSGEEEAWGQAVIEVLSRSIA